MKEWIPAIVSVVTLVAISWSVYTNLTVEVMKKDLQVEIERVESASDSKVAKIKNNLDTTKIWVDRRLVAVEKKQESFESSLKDVVAVFNKELKEGRERDEKLKDQQYETQKSILELKAPIAVIESILSEIKKDK